MKPTRIVGGSEVIPYSIPWQVALVSPGSNDPGCGGTLISDRHVLTAAHCTGRKFDVIVGEHRTTSSEDGTRHSVCRVDDHPSYYFPEYDFSILHLDTPVLIGQRAVPACLPPSSFGGDFLVGKNMTVSGWGDLTEGGVSPSVLHSINVLGISDEQCERMIGGITKDMLCAGGVGGQDSCQKDSGGKSFLSLYLRRHGHKNNTRPSITNYIYIPLLYFRSIDLHYEWQNVCYWCSILGKRMWSTWKTRCL